jgi:hypothetical protein
MNRQSLATFAGGLSQAAGHVSDYIMRRKNELRKEQVANAFKQQFGDKFSAAGLDADMILGLAGGDPGQALTVGRALRGQTHIYGDRQEGRSAVTEDAFGNLGTPKQLSPGTGPVPNTLLDITLELQKPDLSPERRTQLQKSYDVESARQKEQSAVQGQAKQDELILKDSREELRLNTTVNELSADIRKLQQDLKFRQENLGKTAPSARREAQRQLTTLQQEISDKESQLDKARSELKQYDVKRKPPQQAGKDTSWNVSPGGVQFRILG